MTKTAKKAARLLSKAQREALLAADWKGWASAHRHEARTLAALVRKGCAVFTADGTIRLTGFGMQVADWARSV